MRRPSCDTFNSRARSGVDRPLRPAMTSPSRESNEAACCRPNCGSEVTCATPIVRVVGTEALGPAGAVHPPTTSAETSAAIGLHPYGLSWCGMVRHPRLRLFLRQLRVINEVRAIQIL